MLFRSRVPLSFSRRCLDVLWPRIGFRRAGLYWGRRLARLPAGSHGVALGFAFGAAISFTPFVGLQIVLAVLLSWALRANAAAAVIGTIVGNPWTFPFIWLGTYELGAALLDVPGQAPNFAVLETLLSDPTRFGETVWPVFWPMMVGSLPVTVIAGGLSYWLARRGIESLRVKEKSK